MMKAFALALFTLAGIVALVQAQPAATTKPAKSILDAFEVGQWLDMSLPADNLTIRVIPKRDDMTIQQVHAELERARGQRRDRVRGRSDVDLTGLAAAANDESELSKLYRRPPFEILCIGEDHLVVTDGGDSERWIAKHAIHWINRPRSGK